MVTPPFPVGDGLIQVQLYIPMIVLPFTSAYTSFTYTNFWRPCYRCPFSRRVVKAASPIICHVYQPWSRPARNLGRAAWSTISKFTSRLSWCFNKKLDCQLLHQWKLFSQECLPHTKTNSSIDNVCVYCVTRCKPPKADLLTCVAVP